ncbi:MAG TPA: CHAT domain-containing protein, partial [Longimicrobium sp.]|nr:CHAT domain-containing protein [Longimicrobium sp.]
MGKLKVLFFGADPLSANPHKPLNAQSPRLRIDEEIREITQKIRAAEYRDSVEFISHGAVRADDLLQALNEHRPHIVHFSGHGSKAGEIIVVGRDGTPRPLAREALVCLFKTLKNDIRLVLLNACYSQAQAEGITTVIDCAIGMDRAVSDDASIIFAASFYRALGFGNSIRNAFDQATAALQLEGIPEHATPQLLFREGVDPGTITLLHPAPGGPSPAECLDTYLDSVTGTHGRIRFPAFGGALRPGEVRLEQLFVGLRGELATRSQRVAAERAAAALRGVDESEEARYLAVQRHAREKRSTEELLSPRERLNAAEAVKAVSSDFRLVVLGDPGSGKTTLARWIAVRMAAALRDGQTELRIERSDLFAEDAEREGPPVIIPVTRLPILVRVSEYAQFLLERKTLSDAADLRTHALNAALDEVPREQRRGLRSVLERMDQEGRLLIILDGLDELPDPARVNVQAGTPRWKQWIRKTVLEQIRELAEDFRPAEDAAGTPLPRNALLVTSRIKGYDFYTVLPGELTHLTIQPMSGAERTMFFAHWTRAVAETSPELRDAAARFASVLAREVEADRRLSREVTTPQIAGLVASVALSAWHALGRDARDDPASLRRLLPRSRTEIYGRAVDLLLERWEEDRDWPVGTTDERLGALMSERGQLLRVLKEVALAIHEDRALQTGDVDEGQLARIVLDAASRLAIPWQRACDHADTFTGFMIPLLAWHSGFMVPRANGVFSFQHRSIQEYLAGRLLAEGNAADGTRPADWPRLREFLLAPQQLIHWREVTWHGLAHLQLLDAAGFLRLAEECLAAEVAQERPFPVTLLLLLEAAPTLPAEQDPAFIQLLVRHVLLAFSRNVHLREPLWPAFRAALFRLPAPLVGKGLEDAVLELGTGVAAGAAEIVVRLGALRPVTAWMSPFLMHLLIRARTVDDEALSWPIHRCLALTLAAWENQDVLGRVHALTADPARTELARPEVEAALTSDPEFARGMLALTGCIDVRDSVYLWQYNVLARFLALENAARDAWLPFLNDYWGGADVIYDIAVHLDTDFERAVASAWVPPSLNARYALSVNPRFSPRALPPGASRGARVRSFARALGSYIFTLASDERFLLLMSQTGAEVAALRTQGSNRGLVRLVRQRVTVLDDAIHRGAPLVLLMMERTGARVQADPRQRPLWRIAVKAVLRAMGRGSLKGGHAGALPLSGDEAQNGAALAEWWALASSGLVTGEWLYDEWSHEDARVLDRYQPLVQRWQAWFHAAFEVPTAGALDCRQVHAWVPVEGLYPHLPEHYGADELPFHALSTFARSPWQTVPLTRRIAEAVLPGLEAAFPHLAAECRAVRWIIGGPRPGLRRCHADPALVGFEQRILQNAAAIGTPYHRARFLVRMLPYAPP